MNRLEEIDANIKALREERDLVVFAEKANFTPDREWLVSTEGDDEGRTIKRLGVYKGNILDIATSLGYKACYTLMFEPYVRPPEPENAEFREKTTAFITIKLDKCCLDRNEVLEIFRTVGSGVYMLSPGGPYQSVKVEYE